MRVQVMQETPPPVENIQFGTHPRWAVIREITTGDIGDEA